MILPFVPDGGLRELYDRTVGYQASRPSPFSIWGQVESLDWLQLAVKIGAAVLALLVAFVPRRVDARAVAALGAAVLIALQLTATHWFYLYIVWFVPFVLVALFAAHRALPARARARAGAGPGARPRVRRDALAALGLLVAGWALTLWVAPWSDERVNDLFVYRVFAEPVLAGGLPYRDVFFEYPPLAAPVIALPGWPAPARRRSGSPSPPGCSLAAGALVLLCGALAARTGATAAGRCSPPRWRRSPAARCCGRTSTWCRWRSRSRRCGSCARTGRAPGWRCSASARSSRASRSSPCPWCWRGSSAAAGGVRRSRARLACVAVLLAGAVAALARLPGRRASTRSATTSSARCRSRASPRWCCSRSTGRAWVRP